MHAKGGVHKMLNSDTIVYIRVNLTYCIIKFSDGRSQAIALSLKQFEKYLPPNLFCRTHRKYIVALDHVNSVSRNDITVTGGDEIPLSKDFKQIFFSHFQVIAEKTELMEEPL